jgi:hypothetical protein
VTDRDTDDVPTPPEPPAGGPSATCLPRTELLPAFTRLWRVHRAWHVAPSGPKHIPDDGTLFKTGYGEPTRFGPFHAASGPLTGGSVPLLYVGESDHGALYETVLHDQMPGSFVDHNRWATHLLSALELRADLEVISLHGPGLRSLGLYGNDITDTYPHGYPLATRWAAWLHQHVPTAVGLTWRSRQDNSQRAHVLFEDRMPSGALVALDASTGGPDPLPLGYGAGLDWVLEEAAAIRVKVRLP